MKHQTLPSITCLITRRRREYGQSRLKFIHIGFTLLLLLAGAEGYAQNIEKMKKKELQTFLSAKIAAIDSLQQVLGKANNDWTALKNKYDSLATAQQKVLEENRQYKAQNQQLSAALQSLKDSLAYYQKASLADDQIRRKIIDQYLLNKSFGLVYYNLTDVFAPNGASQFIVSKDNNKYILFEQIRGESTTSVADNKKAQRYRDRRIYID